MDPRFGRAQYFLAVDTDSGEYAVHPNEVTLNAVQGAGIPISPSVILLGVAANLAGTLQPGTNLCDH